MNFTDNEYSLIYDAVRLYQLNKTTTSSQQYWECDSILRKLFEKAKLEGIEPGFRTNT